MRGAKPENRAYSRRPVLSPLFYQDDQILFFPAPYGARKWLGKRLRGKRGMRGKWLLIDPRALVGAQIGATRFYLGTHWYRC